MERRRDTTLPSRILAAIAALVGSLALAPVVAADNATDPAGAAACDAIAHEAGVAAFGRALAASASAEGRAIEALSGPAAAVGAAGAGLATASGIALLPVAAPVAAGGGVVLLGFTLADPAFAAIQQRAAEQQAHEACSRAKDAANATLEP